MKIFVLIAAALAGVTALAPASASAAPITAASITAAPIIAAAIVAPQSVNTRVVVRERRQTQTRRYNQGPRRGWSTRRVCENRWRNHRRHRQCRTVRYRR